MELFGKKDKTMEALEEAKEAEKMEAEESQEESEKVTPIRKGRKPFAIWTVGGKEYKLKLGTATIKQLESKYKTNLMNVMGSGEGGMPALSVMLDIAHNAMKDHNHGIKASDVDNLFDKYMDEGGSQLEFYTSVYMDIFAVSGFFSTSLTNQMQSTMEEVRENI